MPLAVLLLLLSPARSWTEPELFCQILDRRINESSGIAPSHLSPGHYFTHNDSGDTSRFFKFNARGEVVGIYRVHNGSAIDWEDMASAVVDGKPRLYFADIGDNSRRRLTVQIYQVDEPKGPSAEVRYKRYDLAYPDGPHNAEALIVQPKTGEFYIVTKEQEGPSYVFKMPPPSRSGPTTLELLGKIQFTGTGRGERLVTGADCSPDGRYVIIRTYTSAYEFAVGANFDDWWSRPRSVVKTAVEAQGEGICYSLEGDRLLTTSEFTPCRVSTMTLAP